MSGAISLKKWRQNLEWAKDLLPRVKWQTHLGW
jgi:hypothetical protein